MKFSLLVTTALLVSSGSSAQMLAPKKLLEPATDTWPTYNGDYSGRRFSTLSQISSQNVERLALAWFYRINNVGPQRGVGSPTIKSTPLMVNGVLYFTIPDHVYAVDARTGEEIWHYDWVDKGGHLIGNRGVGMYGNWIYFLGPDGWFISLNAKDGTERWRKKVADEKLQYFTTMAPMVVKNHEPMVRTLYLDAFQDWAAPRNFAVRTRIHPEALMRDVTRAVTQELPATRIVRVTALADQIDSTIIPERLLAMLSGFFGALGLAIAAIGLYGLLAYMVARRVTEIGVRMALGENRRDVIGMVLRDAFAMVAAGLAVGAVLALWMRNLVGAIFENQTTGPVPVFWAAVVIIGAALLAAYMPARRAAALDPMSALRHE